jgi:hypothetical protein
MQDQQIRQPSHYLFLHVPKTAGSMFRNIVCQNFPGEAAIENPYMSEQVYSAKQIDRLFYLYPYRFFLGHVFRLRNSLQAFDAKLKLISFARDPVEKAISAYHYLRGRDMTNPGHPVRHKTFAEMVDYVLELEEFDSFDLDSSQTDWLVGEKDASVATVEDAVAAGRLIFFPTEEFDLSCVILERMFPEDFRDCSYAEKINVSEKPREISSEDRKAAECLPWIEKDRQLHELANTNLMQLVERLFPTQEELDLALGDFKQRCNNKVQQPQKDQTVEPRRSLTMRLESAVKAFFK